MIMFRDVFDIFSTWKSCEPSRLVEINEYKYCFWILSRVLLTSNAYSGLDERVYLLLIHPTRNYTAIAISTLYNSLLHTQVVPW
jgi:hypothetical protein